MFSDMSAAGRANAKPRQISRRTVLAAAVAGGGGVAAARLLGLRGLGNETRALPAAAAEKQTFDWVSPLGTDAARVAHLLRRTAFGATAADLERAQSEGYARTVDRLVDAPAAPPPALAGADDASQTSAINLGSLQQWWIDHMLTSSTPFAESMTLFWHGHFTSDYRKVGLQYPFIYWQNLTWRAMALSDLRSALHQVTVDPAMLRYLDLGNSTGRSPNENYARELMELFSMGPDAFSETDVRSGAQALAGWREPRTQAMIDGARKQNAGALREIKADSVKTGVFEKQRAFAGRLTFLSETGTFDTDKVIDSILKQEATAPFITRRVVTHFVMPDPEDAYVARLAQRFRAASYDVRSLMRDVLTSDEFTSALAYRSLVKSPTEFMVHAARALTNTGLGRLIATSGQGMGQSLFDPPSVGGWPQNESWISSNTMLARANFVTAAIAATRKLPPADKAHAQHLDSVISPQTLKLLNEAGDDRKRWSLILASPEFQLK